jgi:hypothetical protein
MYKLGGRAIFIESPSFVLAKKLRSLKNHLRAWNIDVFGNVTYGLKTKIIWEEIRQVDVKEECEVHSADSEKGRAKVGVGEFSKQTK